MSRPFLCFERLRQQADVDIPAQTSGLRSFWAGRLWFETVNTTCVSWWKFIICLTENPEFTRG